MLLEELIESINEKQIWGRRGSTTVRKYRCTSGMRKGRIVATAAQSFAAPNIKARFALKRTKAKLGKKMTRKALRTKRTNPASIALKRLNRRIK